MRRYNVVHNIVIDGQGVHDKKYGRAQDYEKAIFHQLNSLHGSHTGKALLDEVSAANPRMMLIVPFEKKGDNAFAKPMDEAHAWQLGGGAILHQILHKVAPNVVPSTETEIHYSPSTWAGYASRHHGHNAGAHPDEVLLHEMTHGLRQMLGLARRAKLKDNYDTEEEFFAILVANIYGSEKKRGHDIRRDHHGHLEQSDKTSAKFLPNDHPDPRKDPVHEENFRLVARMVREQDTFCRKLAQIDCPFNPIRRYYELEAKPAQHAKSKTAGVPVGAH